jgi:mannose-6-phosphate isomerase-like protein (cupin superfamily)
MRTVLVFTLAAFAAGTAFAQQPQTTGDPAKAFYLSSADVSATIAKLTNVAYANITVLERADASSSTGLGYRLAVDRRRPPQNGAVHATEAELWAIIDGAGTIVTGGRVVEVRKDGQVVSRHIEGGTAQKVAKGDFLFIPEGVPHQVTEFTPSLTMVTLELPRPRTVR